MKVYYDWQKGKISSIKTDSFWSFSTYCLISLFFDCNTYALITRRKYRVFLEKHQVMFQFKVGTISTELLKAAVLVWINVLILLLSQRGSLSSQSHTTVSFVIKLLRIEDSFCKNIYFFANASVSKESLCIKFVNCSLHKLNINICCAKSTMRVYFCYCHTLF